MSRFFAVFMVLLALAGNAEAQQGAKLECWNNVTLAEPQQLADNPSLLGTPSTTQTLVNFDAPVNRSGQFVCRITARVVVPEGGSYIYWMASNGIGKAWWSTTQSFAGAAPMVRMMQSVYPSRNQWTRYAEQKSSINPMISHQASQTIYLMLIYSDTVVDSGTNINHASLKWQLPSGLQEGPIPGARITVPPTPPPAPSSMTLAWNANPEPDLAGYRIQWGASSTSFTSTADVGNVTQRRLSSFLTLSGTYYFRVLAYNTAGQQSTPSSVVSANYVHTGSTQTLTTRSGITIDSNLPPPEDGVPASDADAPAAPRNIRLDVLEQTDLWIEKPEELGWKARLVAAWQQSARQKPVLVQRDWILSLDNRVEMPGQPATLADIAASSDGLPFRVRTTYTPEDGTSYATVAKPGGGFVNATRLVWFHHVVSANGEARYYPMAAAAVLEDGSGYAMFTRGQDGQWATTMLSAQAQFDLFLPNAERSASPYNVVEPLERGQPSP